MFLLDLKLALFIGLLCVTGWLIGAWWIAGHYTAQPQKLDGVVWQTFEVLPFGIVVTRSNGVIVFSNAAAQRMLETLESESATALRQLLRRFNDSLQSEAQRSGLIYQPLPLRWWRYQLADQCVLLVLADAAEQQRFMRQQQAFTGQLVHELRTPLTALAAHIEIARSPQMDEAVRQSSLETIQHETQRMARLVRDLLELHRLETAADLPLQPTNVVLVAEDVIAQIILRAEERGLCLTLDVDAPLPLVLAQPDRLKQVFLNLLDNTVKYCRPGDAVRVCLEAQPKGVQCLVQDTGPGIASGDLPYVTERFYRGRTDVEGSGIGLALVNEILRRHHASLYFESTTEGSATGTTARWTLLYATTSADSENLMGMKGAETVY